MDTATVVAVAGLAFAVLANTCVVAFWAGKTTQLLRDHDRRLRRLERLEE